MVWFWKEWVIRMFVLLRKHLDPSFRWKKSSCIIYNLFIKLIWRIVSYFRYSSFQKKQPFLGKQQLGVICTTVKQILYILYNMPRNRYEFTLTIIGVEDLINISTFGKRDTFIEIEYSNNKYMLPTIHDAGNCPCINHSLLSCLVWESNLSLSGNDNHVRIIV